MCPDCAHADHIAQCAASIEVEHTDVACTCVQATAVSLDVRKLRRRDVAQERKKRKLQTQDGLYPTPKPTYRRM